MFPEELYSAEPTTTLAEPVGCCSDYVGDTTVEVPANTLPATGGDVTPLVGVGVVVGLLGVVAVLVARRPKTTTRPATR